jgi:uncharacterized protein with HEPN domain
VKPGKSSRDWTLRIKDIIDSIEKIEHYTHGMSFAEFKKNTMVNDAVVRNFEIIGEASKHIPVSVQHSHPHIPWKQM